MGRRYSSRCQDGSEAPVIPAIDYIITAFGIEAGLSAAERRRRARVLTNSPAVYTYINLIKALYIC